MSVLQPLILLKIAQPIIGLFSLVTGVTPDVSTALGDISSITDVLGHSWIERKRFQHQLDSIAETIAADLSDVIDAEYASLTESDRIAVVNAVGDSLALLTGLQYWYVDASLNRDHVKEIINGEGADRIRDSLFSVDCQELYNVLLDRSLERLSDLSLQLPQYTPAAVRNLLANQERFINDVMVAISRPLESRTDQSGTDENRFRALFLEALASRNDILEIAGVDLEPLRKRYRLTPAYTALGLREDDKGETTATDLLLESLLNENPLILISGDPGAGKTTLLKWISITLARNSSPERMPALAGVIPFVVKLRSLETFPPRIEDLPRLSVPDLPIEAPSDWPTETLEAGKALLLIDGLDEVSGDQRVRIVEWLKSLTRRWPQLRMVVTTRPAALRETPFDIPGFKRVFVLPMNLAQMSDFIDFWHRTVDVSVARPGAVPQQIASDLKARLYGDLELRRLASNPLICAVVCALHLSMGRSLPSRRQEVYNAALRMLVRDRDAERRVRSVVRLTGSRSSDGGQWLVPTEEDETKLQLSVEERLTLLKELSFWLTLQGKSEVSEADATAILEVHLQKMRSAVRDLSGSTVLEEFVVRCGVLRYAEPLTLEFVHRTFQEYLAAAQFVQARYLPLLSEHLMDAEWHQIIVWSVTLMVDEEQANSLVSMIVELMAVEVGSRQVQLTVLALECVENAMRLDPELRRSVSTAGESLVPPTDMDIARALAGAGEAAIPLVSRELRRHSLSHREAELCIEVLLQIGGTDALAVLAAVPEHRLTPLARRLAAAWSNFHPADFARSVLSRVPPSPPLVRLVIRDRERAEFAYALSEAYEKSIELAASALTLSPEGRLRAKTLRLLLSGDYIVKPIAGVESIESLILVGPSAVRGDLIDEDDPRLRIRRLRVEADQECTFDTDALLSCADLEEIELVGPVGFDSDPVFQSDDRNLSVRMQLPQESCVRDWQGIGLTNLEIIGWPGRDLWALSALTSLVSLAILDSDSLISAAGIGEFDELELLNLSGCESLLAIPEVAELPSLARLVIEGCSMLTELPLEDLADVEIDADGSGVSTGYADREPEIVFDRWADVSLETVGDDELRARGWSNLVEETAEIIPESIEEYENWWPEPTEFSQADADARGYLIIDDLAEYERGLA